MPDYAHFIAAIREKDALARRWHPPLVEVDTDGPRLVFADWLEENGETDRAELIRVQVQAANILPVYRCFVNDEEVLANSIDGVHQKSREIHRSLKADELWRSTAVERLIDDQEERLKRRANQILKATNPERLADGNKASNQLFWSVPWFQTKPTFVRGFITETSLTWVQWESNWRDILAVHPIGKVRLTTFPPVSRSTRLAAGTFRFEIKVGDKFYWSVLDESALGNAGNEEAALALMRGSITLDLLAKVDGWEGITFELPAFGPYTTREHLEASLSANLRSERLIEFLETDRGGMELQRVVHRATGVRLVELESAELDELEAVIRLFVAEYNEHYEAVRLGPPEQTLLRWRVEDRARQVVTQVERMQRENQPRLSFPMV